MKTQSIYKILTVTALLALSFGAQAGETKSSAPLVPQTKDSVVTIPFPWPTKTPANTAPTGSTKDPAGLPLRTLSGPINESKISASGESFYCTFLENRAQAKEDQMDAYLGSGDYDKATDVCLSWIVLVERGVDACPDSDYFDAYDGGLWLDASCDLSA